MIIGIVGTAGSGKTTLLNNLPSTYNVIYVDEIVKNIHQLHPQINFSIFKTNNKKEIFNIILQDTEKRKRLENELKPLVIKQINNKLKQNKINLIEMANMIESDVTYLVDVLVCIHIKPIFASYNLHNYRDLSLEFIKQLQNLQLSADKMAKVSDFTFYRSSNLNSDIATFKLFLNKIVQQQTLVK